MASARNEAPRGWSVRKGCLPSLRTRGGVWGCGYAPSPELFFGFWVQNGELWCILEANFIALELSVLYAHKAGKPRLWLVKPAIALLCVKKVGGIFAWLSPSASWGHVLLAPLVDTSLVISFSLYTQLPVAFSRQFRLDTSDQVLMDVYETRWCMRRWITH